MNRLAALGQAGALTAADLEGGTFTVSACMFVPLQSSTASYPAGTGGECRVPLLTGDRGVVSVIQYRIHWGHVLQPHPRTTPGTYPVVPACGVVVTDAVVRDVTFSRTVPQVCIGALGKFQTVPRSVLALCDDGKNCARCVRAAISSASLRLLWL